MLKLKSKDWNIIFTSDLHINHKNYCEGVSDWKEKDSCRNFSTLEEMNYGILQSFFLLPKNTIIFSLGDFLFGHNKDYNKWLNMINTNRIYYLFGNHCKPDLFSINTNVCWYGDILRVVIDNIPIIMCHYPLFSWEDMDRVICLHGHTHGIIEYPKEFKDDLHMKIEFDTISPSHTKPKILDVGIDNYYKLYGEYKYFTWQEVKNILNLK
jgi:calcineurin-like phosphoesterase family protein